MKYRLRVKRRTWNASGYANIGTGGVYLGKRLSGWFFTVEWQWKPDAPLCMPLPFGYESNDLRSCVVRCTSSRLQNISFTFYWEPERGYFCPTAGVSGGDIHVLVSQCIQGERQ